MTSSKTHLSRLNPPYRPGTQRPSQAHPLGSWPIRGVEAGEVGLRGGHSGSGDIGSLADIGGMGFAGVIARRWLLASRPAGVIAVESETGGYEEFVVMDIIGIKEEKFVIVVEAKASCVGLALKQCLLALKDIQENNDGGAV
ncbi:hypothetical protein EV426DRAFT_719911 [Tirmania nivea]|nr:hypothetical protein EV426DRAFT_719911 [Tirmania nivea]